VEQLLPLLSPTPGIGHNNPPPLERDELDEIKSDIALLKAQLPPPQEATKIASKFVRVAGRVLTWFGKHFDTAVDAAMKEGGKNAVRAAGLSALWMTFGQQLTDAATAIWYWAMTLPGIGP
jgi:hypothetical protein